MIVFGLSASVGLRCFVPGWVVGCELFPIHELRLLDCTAKLFSLNAAEHRGIIRHLHRKPDSWCCREA